MSTLSVKRKTVTSVYVKRGTLVFASSIPTTVDASSWTFVNTSMLEMFRFQALKQKCKEVKSKLKEKDDEIILLANRIDSLSVLVEEQKKQPIIADEIKLLKNRIKTLEAENYVFGEAIDYFDKATKTFLSTAAKGSIQDSSFKDLCQEIALNFWDYIESTI